MSTYQQTRALGHELRRIISGVQFILASAVILSFIFYVWENFDAPYYWRSDYDFVTAFFSTLMATSIIIAIIAQRRSASPTIATTFYFEIFKSVMATGLWFWLLMDSILVDRSPSYGDQGDYRMRRIFRAFLAVILLILFFLAPMSYTWYEKWIGRTQVDENPEVGAGQEGGTERTPLLGGSQ